MNEERFKVAYNEWMDKTDWVQARKDWPFPELGMHRADVMRKYIEHLERQLAKLEPQSSKPGGLFDAVRESAKRLGQTAQELLDLTDNMRTGYVKPAPVFGQEPVAREFMFNVGVEGKAHAVFDTADEAVRFSMHHVYLCPGRFQEACDTLNQGQVFMYSYGFSAVNIVPIAKRKLPNTRPAPAVAINEQMLEALEEMVSITYRVDGWESFPSAPIEKSEAAIAAAEAAKGAV